MKKTPIRIPGLIRERQWAIPVEKDAYSVERTAMKQYDEYMDYLASYGFEKVYETQSLSHTFLQFQGDRPTGFYSLWHHPAGIIAKADSTSSGGYMGSNGQYRPEVRALNSIDIYAQLDIGVGSELQHRASCNLIGSGGVNAQMDGSEVRDIRDSFHSNTSDCLASFLKKVQPHGKFIPVSKWKKVRGRNKISLHNELLYPLLTRPDREIKSVNDVVEGVDLMKLYEEVMSQLPKELRGNFRDPQQRGLDKNDTSGSDWMVVEDALTIFSEALFFDKKRWQGSYNSDLLEYWCDVLHGRHGSDIEGFRAYETGPAGLSLPITLIHAKHNLETTQWLYQILEDAPLDVLKQWATVPDATGYTLALHAVARLFYENQMKNHKPGDGVAGGVLKILHRRLGNEGLVLTTQTRSILGIPLQFDDWETKPVDLNGRKNINETHEAFTKIITMLDEWGVNWKQDLRWRDYPNTVMKGGRMPSFYSIEGPVSVTTWKELMAQRYTTGLDGVKAALAFGQLEEIMKEIRVDQSPQFQKPTAVRVKI